MRLPALVSVAVACLVCTGCGSGRQVRLDVSPHLSAEDQPLSIQLGGLKAGEQVRLELNSTDAKGIGFVSHAVFRADKEGIVDLDKAAPSGLGSYRGVWSSGLLAGLVPASGKLAYYWWGDTPQAFRLRAIAAGRQLAETTFERRWSTTDYTTRKLTVARDGIYGNYYAPVGAKKRPAVLAFGGSEGGGGGGFQSRYAANGIPVLAIAYFHAPGLPDRLVNIPLEYFRRALVWLAHQPQVDPHRITVSTGSYGSEAALELAIHYPKLVHKVVATVPSAVVTCGIAGAHRDSTGGYCQLGAPWTLDGKPLPYTHQWDDPDPSDVPAAVIPVWRIKGQVLLACAGADELWSSCPYARAILSRRKAQGEQTTLEAYPGAGHFVGDAEGAYEPGAMALDVTAPATERGREDLWPRILRFIRS